MSMYIYEPKPRCCAECGFMLSYNHVDTQFESRRSVLVHPSNICRFSGKTFYMPKEELTELSKELLVEVPV